MKLHRAIKLQSSRLQHIKELISRAEFYGYSSSELNSKINDILERAPILPRWANNFILGYVQCKRDEFYENGKLIFLFIGLDGELIDTKKMPLNYSHQRICKENLKSGHFWVKTMKPYFIGKD